MMGVGFSIVTHSGVGTQPATVEVHQRLGQPTSYRVRYPLEESEGSIPLLADEALQPDKALQVLVPAGAGASTMASLVRGPIQGQHAHVEHGLKRAWVDVYGADVLARMDWDVRHKTWQGTDSDALRTVLGEYVDTAHVDETTTSHREEDHVLVQAESNLRFARRLAGRNGLWLWVESTPEGRQLGYARAPSLTGSPEAELRINARKRNIDELDLYWDAERPTEVVTGQLGLRDKKPMTATKSAELDSAPPGKKRLADLAGTRQTKLVAAVDFAGELAARADALTGRAGWFVRVRCTSTVHRLGTVVQAHQLVRLVGLGTPHDGVYYVAEAKHTVDAKRHRMELELVRDHWLVSDQWEEAR